MSVINQVLDQLERRGAHATLKQNMVRVVPQARRSPFVLVLAISGALLLAGLVSWLSWQARRDAAASQPETPPQVAMPIVFSPVSSVVDAPAVSGVPVVEPISAVSAVEPAPEEMLPASRLSLELSAPSVQEPKRKPDAGAVRAEVPSKKPAPSQVAQPAAEPAMPLKQVSQAQQADAEFRRGLLLMQQGRSVEAIASYQAALRLDAAHDRARQALVALLLEQHRRADAERVLQERLGDKPEHAGFAMLLARLQVERAAEDEGLATLERSLHFADGNAEYRAFFAALLQRNNRHAEAVAHYQAALQLQPNHGAWAMGYGISLQALGRNDAAKAAFQRALESKGLSPELQAFVQQRIKALQ